MQHRLPQTTTPVQTAAAYDVAKKSTPQSSTEHNRERQMTTESISTGHHRAPQSTTEHHKGAQMNTGNHSHALLERCKGFLECWTQTHREPQEATGNHTAPQ